MAYFRFPRLIRLQPARNALVKCRHYTSESDPAVSIVPHAVKATTGGVAGEPRLCAHPDFVGQEWSLQLKRRSGCDTVAPET